MLVELLACSKNLQVTTSKLTPFQKLDLPDLAQLKNTMKESYNFESDELPPMKHGVNPAYDVLCKTKEKLLKKCAKLRDDFCKRYLFESTGRTPEFKAPGVEGGENTQALVELTPGQYRTLEAKKHNILKIGETQTRIRILFKVSFE
jgi:hypothetical protein